MRRTILAAAAALALAATGCGSDDGAGVRTIEGDGGSVSGSASGSSSASGPGSASGSASGGGSASESEAASASGSGSGSGLAVDDCVPGDVSGADTSVEVDLVEWDVIPDPDEVSAGTIAFLTSTESAVEPHELVIARGDDPEGLPTDDDGAVDESQLAEGDLIGEIEAYPAGTTCEGAFDLPAGDYVLFCNIVETEEDGTVEAHYAQGMTTGFTVTE